jgi:hypothetical protein
VANEWMPQLLKNGIKRYAHNFSKDVFAAMSAEELSQRVLEYSFEFQIFGSKHEAEQWLTGEVTA